MKHILKHKLRLPLAFLLSLLLIFEGMSVAVFATDMSDTTVGTEVDTGMLIPEPPDMVVEDIESDVIISPPDISGADDEQASVNATTSQPFADGIYAFRNVGNNGIYMDTQYDSSSPGYKLQQYAYSPSPLQTFANGGFANGGIFKLSYRADLGTYVMRSMTNNLLSYTFSSDNYVITHEIPADDADVAPEDTFEFVRQPSGYVIQKYNSDDCIAAQNSTASGAAGAPYSYLIKGTLATSGAQAHWRLFHYTTYDAPTRDGYLMEQEPTADDLVAGETVTFKVKTWSTRINYNAPRLYANTSGIVSSTWNESNYTLSTFILNQGTFNMRINIRNGTNYSQIDSRPYTAVLPFEEGTYYFMNRQTEKYMQIDDVGSTTMDALDRDDEDVDVKEQQWIIEHHEGKYYTIKSKSNFLYVSVPSGSYNSNNVDLRLQSFTGANGQLWYFETSPSSTSSYIIRPKSGESYNTDWCINVKTTIFGTNASDVIQGDFRDNTSYYDEWILELVDTKEFTFVGVPNDGHDHSSSLETARENLRSYGFNNISIIEHQQTPNECLGHLTETNVFISRSHGEALCRANSTVAETTGIILNNYPTLSKIGLYSHESTKIPTGSSHIDSFDIFDDLELAVFVGCQTGYVDGTANNDGPGNNLPYVVVSQGGEVAIGFRDDITCGEANQWTEQFIAALLDGEPVEVAVQEGFEGLSSNSTMQSFVIYGNSNYSIFD